MQLTSTPQVPFKAPQIPSNRDHQALKRGTLGGAGTPMDFMAAAGQRGCAASDERAPGKG